MLHFNKGEAVEATHPNNPTKRNRLYPASVLRTTNNNRRLLLQYHTLFSDHPPNNPLRCWLHLASVACVRPKPPDFLNPWFKVGDHVDAFCETNLPPGGGAWCSATVEAILENSKYAVSFWDDNGNGKTERGVVEQCRLRLHREWVHGNWVPPLPYQTDNNNLQYASSKPKKLKADEAYMDQPLEIVTMTNTGNLRFKIKYSRRPVKESKFKKGRMVEVRDENEGFEGAWFIGTIVSSVGKDRFLVEFRDLITDDGTHQLLKEEVHEDFIRPCPPEVPSVSSFKQFQEVDAWYNDAWWEGVVLEVVNSRECFVSFIHKDVLRFENSKLRPHQDWFDGKWVMASKESSELTKKFGDVMSKAKNLTGNKIILKCLKSREPEPQKVPRVLMSMSINTSIKLASHLCKGAKVEVTSDEEGYQGAWYTAIVVNSLQNGRYVVEYLTLKTDDLTEQLKEEADASNIRPVPPDIQHRHRYALRERVDAWFNDGWWEGQVCGFSGFNYRIYFWPTKEELEFEHCHLRPHKKWIDGRWVHAPFV
ncbi:hypothetical protein PIB30_058655 [Stylosanthes scabra]|uniref:Agenet domain-containing protein n=1 Tax=Stylosanthes scabra TaxID=79078 RepID=A0ABU6XJU7_9FABA|nr:hypothetical protein [Stylosanthes scabra]